MSMLRNIPSSELADIISGNSPNPILEAAPTEFISSIQSSDTSELVTENQPVISPSGVESGVPNYQHAMHSLLRKQISSKRKSMRDRRSLPCLDSGKPQEADKDVVEMSLDDEPLNSHMSSTSNVTADADSLKSPVYPAMLLNETQSKTEDTTSKPTTTARMLGSLNTLNSTSAPDMFHWNRTIPEDYFSNEPVPTCKF